MPSDISIVVPVGPNKHHIRYLDECLESVFSQTVQPNEVLLIDDMQGLPDDFGEDMPGDVWVWRSPWRLGVAHAFNFGVALVRNQCVFLLGADDRLLPQCLEKCLAKYEERKQADGYYFVPVAYSDGREDQNLPCCAAMVTKGLWRKTGGFPTESAVGASDSAFVSMAIGSPMKQVCSIYEVGKLPLYWYRVHDQSDTAGKAPWQGVILGTRNLVTLEWKPPEWGRYS